MRGDPYADAGGEMRGVRGEKGAPKIEWLERLDRSMFTQAAQFPANERSRDTRTRGVASATLSLAAAMYSIAVVRGWVLGGGEGEGRQQTTDCRL